MTSPLKTVWGKKPLKPCKNCGLLVIQTGRPGVCAYCGKPL